MECVLSRGVGSHLCALAVVPPLLLKFFMDAVGIRSETCFCKPSRRFAAIIGETWLLRLGEWDEASNDETGA